MNPAPPVIRMVRLFGMQFAPGSSGSPARGQADVRASAAQPTVRGTISGEAPLELLRSRPRTAAPMRAMPDRATNHTFSRDANRVLRIEPRLVVLEGRR